MRAQPVAHPPATPASAPPGTPLGIQSAANPLSANHLQELAAARAQARALRRAVGVASFNAWAVSIAAAVTLLGGLTSLPALLLGLALGVAAFAEFRGRTLLRTLDDRAPKHLAVNQIFVALQICVYCAWSIRSAVRGQSSLAIAAAGDPEVTAALAPIDSLVSTVTVAVYGTVILITLLIQSLAAWYYLSRAGHIRRFRGQTPAWILDLYRRGTLA